MSLPSKLANSAFRLLPSDNLLLYRFCRKVFHRYNGDNDTDIRTNGEHVLMRRVLPLASVIFDVGANVGDWTADAVAVNPTASYHLFEPSPSTYSQLERCAFPPNVTLNNAGLGAAEGELELFVFGEGIGSNSLYDRRGTDAVEQRRERVRITTLDAYCAEHRLDHVDFVKIDVEGHELAVLRGATDLLRAGRIDVLQFEYGGTYIDARVLLKDVFDFVLSLNPAYSFFKLYHDGPRLVPAYRQEIETFQFSNWVIAKGGLLS